MSRALRIILVLYLVAVAMVLGMATAASAGGGWYLMTPPPDSIRDKPTPPLSQWEQFAAFNTVDQCQAAKAQLFEWRKTDLGKIKIEQYEAGLKAVWAAGEGLCVSSDDPRVRP